MDVSSLQDLIRQKYPAISRSIKSNRPHTFEHLKAFTSFNFLHKISNIQLKAFLMILQITENS